MKTISSLIIFGVSVLLMACAGSGAGSSSSGASPSLKPISSQSSSSSLATSSADTSSAVSLSNSSRSTVSSLSSSSSSLASSSLSAGLYPSYNTNPIVPDMTGMGSAAVQIASKIKMGVNIGNTMEAFGCTPPSETCWGQPMVSAAYMKLVKDSGFEAVRIPAAWDQYADQKTGKISDARLVV